MVYRKLPDKIDNPGPILGELRRCREAMLAASSRVKPGGVLRSRLSNGGRRDRLTGDAHDPAPDYFWNRGSAPASDAMRAREDAEREAEAGLRSWPDDG